jgi:hypothetical protein
MFVGTPAPAQRPIGFAADLAGKGQQLPATAFEFDQEGMCFGAPYIFN